MEDTTVTIRQDTLDDLNAVAQVLRRDHRDVLADAVEQIRAALLPRPKTAPTGGAKARPKTP